MDHQDHQEGDFPTETSDDSESDCEESSEIDSEVENCSATALIDALSDIPNQSKFHDLNSGDKLSDDFLLKSFQKVSLFFRSILHLKRALRTNLMMQENILLFSNQSLGSIPNTFKKLI